MTTTHEIAARIAAYRQGLNDLCTLEAAPTEARRVRLSIEVVDHDHGRPIRRRVVQLDAVSDEALWFEIGGSLWQVSETRREGGVITHYSGAVRLHPYDSTAKGHPVIGRRAGEDGIHCRRRLHVIGIEDCGPAPVPA